MFSAFSLFPFLLSKFSSIVTCYCKAAPRPSGFRKRSWSALIVVLERNRPATACKKQRIDIFLAWRYAKIEL